MGTANKICNRCDREKPQTSVFYHWRAEFPFGSMQDSNFHKCWALSNLRPLCAKKNLIKGVKAA